MFLGIDLGTTNSSLAFIDGPKGTLESVRLSPQDTPYDKLLRSVVLINADGEIEAVGERAAREKHVSSKDCKIMESFKPYLNRWALLEKKVQLIETVNGYSLHSESFKTRRRRIETYINGPYSRNELVCSSSAIMSHLFNIYKSKYPPPKGIYVGIPFNAWDFTKKRILHAIVKAEMASSYKEALKKTHFVYEPVAIAFNLSIAGATQNVMIFDFGGGTLDLAVLEFTRLSGHQLEPAKLLSLGGLPIAGRHIDLRVKQYLVEREGRLGTILEKMDAGEHYIFDQQIESMKVKLSRQKEATENSGKGFLMKLTRLELEKLIAPLLEKIKGEILRTLKGCKLEPVDIQTVYSVGGSSLIPCVQDLLETIFLPEYTEIIRANPISTESGGEVENALTAVSRGLALYGAKSQLRQKCPYEYGIFNPSDEKFYPILEAGIPFEENGTAISSINHIEIGNESESTTLCIYQRYLGLLEFVFQIINIPCEGNELLIKCVVEKDSPLPIFEVLDKYGRLLCSTNPHKLNEEKALKFIENDHEPLTGIARKQSDAVILRRVCIGDKLKFRENRLRNEPSQGEGTVCSINKKKIDEKRTVNEASWKLTDFFMKMGQDRSSFKIEIRQKDVTELEPSSNTYNIFEEQLENN